jgi:hypothetical protein
MFKGKSRKDNYPSLTLDRLLSLSLFTEIAASPQQFLATVSKIDIDFPHVEIGFG